MAEPAIWSSRELRLAIAKEDRGGIVRFVRKARGWTQAELGQRCNCSHSVISRLERGGQELRDIRLLETLARVLEIPPHLLGLAHAASRPTDPHAIPHPRTDSVTDRVPAQLPMDIQGFVGRGSELDTLDAMLTPAGKKPTTVVISAVSGTAGVGKTALAVHWAHRISHRFPDGQLYVNLRGFDPSGAAMEPAEAVRGFLDELGVDPQRVPKDLGAQAARYRSLVSGKRILIVLDNARDTDQVRDLLPGTPGCLVIVTSRNTLTGLVTKQGASPITLGLLTGAESLQLLEHRLGEERMTAEPVAVNEVVDACAGLPMALAIVAARAITRPHFSLASLAGELLDNRARLDALREMEPDVDLRSVFSWSYEQLSPQAKRLFRALGVHPGPDASTAAIASLSGHPPTATKALLSELIRSHLVTEHAPGRYGFHDLLRVYANDLAQGDGGRTERETTLRMLDHYLHSAYAADRMLRPGRSAITIGAPLFGVVPELAVGSSAAMSWFIVEHPVLLGVLDRAVDAGCDTHVWQLAWALDTFLNRQGHWRDHAAVWQRALDAAGRLGDLPQQARAHRLLGRAHIELECFSEAHADLRHSIDMLNDLGDPEGSAHSYGELSRLFERQGRFADAVDSARRALELFRATGRRDGQANALNDIGWSSAQLGDYDQALDACGQSVVLHRELDNTEGEAIAWDSLGYVHHHLAHHVQAIACYRRALGLFVDLGDRQNEAATLSNLADTQEAMGEVADAEESLTRALAIYEQLDHVDGESVRAKLDRIRIRGP